MKNIHDAGTPNALPETVLDSIAEQKVHLTYALDACTHIGELLKFIPEIDRKAAVTALRNEASYFVKERQPFAAMMLFQMAEAWNSNEE